MRYGIAFWITRPDGAVLLRRRPEKGLLGGMIEIPSTPWRAEPVDPRRSDRRRARGRAAQWSPLPGIVRHGFTHFQLELADRRAGMGDPPWKGYGARSTSSATTRCRP